jgi:hypothetical protein
MKKQYFKPELSVMIVELQQIIAISGVDNTSSFSETLSDETTDQALSRLHSMWDEEE